MSETNSSGGGAQSKKCTSAVEVNIQCIVKGYQECDFSAKVEEKYIALKKHGSRGKAFWLCSGRGQLGHLQREVVEPLWSNAHNSTLE